MHSLFRLKLNTFILSLLLLSFFNKMTGSFLHEVVGLALLLLIGVHTFFNFHWFTLFWKQKKRFHRLFNTIILLLMVLSFFVLIASSFMISKSLFTFLGFKSTLFLRQLHITSAYWFFLLCFLHLGIHWHRFSVLLQKKFRIHTRLSHPFFAFISILIVLYAGVVFTQRDIASKLLMTFAFEFLDASQSFFSVAFDYIIMAMALIIFTRYCFKLQKNFQ